MACEVLIPTPAIRHLIREGNTHQIPSAIQTGALHNMQTMDAALADLVRRGTITRELALNRCSSPDTFERLLMHRGLGVWPPEQCGRGAGADIWLR